MLKSISKLLVLLATIQFTNASAVNMNIEADSVNVFQGNQGNIFNGSNNNNYLTNDIHNALDKVDKAINILNIIATKEHVPSKIANGNVVKAQIKIINDNVPTIVNNLHKINDNKYIWLLQDIRLMITNQDYISKISNKLNDLAKTIVDSFRIEEGDNKNIDLDDFNDHSKGATYSLWLSAQ